MADDWVLDALSCLLVIFVDLFLGVLRARSPSPRVGFVELCHQLSRGCKEVGMGFREVKTRWALVLVDGWVLVFNQVHILQVCEDEELNRR